MIKKTTPTKILFFIKKEFLLGGHLQALSSVGVIIISALLLKIAITWDSLTTFYLLFYAIYAFDRYQGLKQDAFTNSQRTAHIKSYKKFIPLIIATSILLAFVILIFKSNLTTIIFSVILIFSGLLYGMVFKPITKRIIAFKNLYVSVFFACLVFVPIIYYQIQVKNLIFIQLIVLFLLIFSRYLLFLLLIPYHHNL